MNDLGAGTGRDPPSPTASRLSRLLLPARDPAMARDLGGLRQALPQGGDDSARKNMVLLVQLRWIAVAGQVITIAVAHLLLGVALPLPPMTIVLASLVVLNTASALWLARGGVVSEGGLLAALLLDVAALTVQLYLSGGATNPFTSLYLLQLTLAAVLLNTWITIGLVALTATAFVGLTAFYHPLELAAGSYAQTFRLYLDGALLGFVLDATLIAVFVTRISRNLRERDARLAALRQQAAEEDHIVRMGLLASGAAHELGTPLSSLSVILGDWRRMPEFARLPDIARDIDEMERALAQCKAIVTGILLAAGAPRGEASHLTSIRGFASELASEWRFMRNCECLTVRNEVANDRPIVSDTALKQVIFNILDNAIEVSPQAVHLTVSTEADRLRIVVEDEGPGFAPEMLPHIGEPYASSKGRLGGGLGLFLATNVARKLGGRVSARNRVQGGAEVTITLPMGALAV